MASREENAMSEGNVYKAYSDIWDVAYGDT